MRKKLPTRIREYLPQFIFWTALLSSNRSQFNVIQRQRNPQLPK